MHIPTNSSQIEYKNHKKYQIVEKWIERHSAKVFTSSDKVYSRLTG